MVDSWEAPIVSVGEPVIELAQRVPGGLLVESGLLDGYRRSLADSQGR